MHLKSYRLLNESIDFCRVLDIRGDFSRVVERSSGRRDTNVEFSWNANRNPLQKLVLRTLLEPSVMNPNDWNALVLLNYPGTYIKGNLAAMTKGNVAFITPILISNRLIDSRID